MPPTWRLAVHLLTPLLAPMLTQLRLQHEVKAVVMMVLPSEAVMGAEEAVAWLPPMVVLVVVLPCCPAVAIHPCPSPSSRHPWAS